jgi:hypothetical protein
MDKTIYDTLEEDDKIYDNEDTATRIYFGASHASNYELSGKMMRYFEYDCNTCGADIDPYFITAIVKACLYCTTFKDTIPGWVIECHIDDYFKVEGIKWDILREENDEVYFSDKIINMPIIQKGEDKNIFKKRFLVWVGKYKFSNPTIKDYLKGEKHG